MIKKLFFALLILGSRYMHGSDEKALTFQEKYNLSAHVWEELQKKSDINIPYGARGVTLLHMAVLAENKYLVQLLVEKRGAWTRSLMRYSKYSVVTPLELARKLKYEDIINYLYQVEIDKGFHTNYTPFSEREENV